MLSKIKKITKSHEFSNYLLFFVCWIMYAIACIGKNAFSASNAAIVKEGLFTKDNLGLIGAGFYLFYAFGQLFGGRVVDKFDPKKLVSVGMIGAASSCFIISLTENYYLILFLWCLNGILQFAIFPSAISIISTKLHKDFRRKALTYFAFSTPAGTLLSYLISSILLVNYRWTSVFLSTALITVAGLIMWISLAKSNINEPSTETKVRIKRDKEKIPWKLLFSAGLIPISLGAFLKSSLDLGAKAWIPTMLMETYDLTASFSVFLTIFLTIINIAGVFIADFVLKKFKGNEVKTVAFFFLACLPFVIGLLFMSKLNLYISVAFMAIFTTLMSSNTQVILMYVPTRFAKYNCVGTVTGILNAFAAFGTFSSTYFFGLIAEHLGWTSTVVSWILLASAGFIFFALSNKKWKKFLSELNS